MNKCSHNHTYFSRDGMIPRASELLKTMGDPTRLEILCLLMEGERQVGNLVSCLKYSQSAISHQLRFLRNLHLVKTRREGRNVFYALDDHHVVDMIRVALDHVREDRGISTRSGVEENEAEYAE